MWLIGECTTDAGWTAFLKLRPLTAVGVVSYGAYVVHLLIGRLVVETYWRMTGISVPHGPKLLLVVSVATLLVAALSWRFFEGPINALKVHLAYWPKPVLAPEERPAR
jgi:peptidoglycan/LPS O-acetylase OafA/YrhL